MVDATTTFFEALGRSGREPLIAKFSGSVLFNVTDRGQTEHWRLAFDGGTVSVTHDLGDADCTISGDRKVFDRVSRGEANAMAAVLRGALVCTGDVEMLLAIQRIFRGPPATVEPEAPR
jgi:putative sterol carrier protein